MPFPLTHLLVADKLLNRRPRLEADAAQFILGSIAPDAVHYRKDISNDMGGIGPIKKITHLCPINDEPWGYVADNAGWVECIKNFVKSHIGPLAEGYAAHVLTDLYNNKTMWYNFRTRHSQEAAKGYKSGIYGDFRNLDARLFLDSGLQVKNIFHLLANAEACDMQGLVTAEEIEAIKNNILFEQYKTHLPNPSREYTFVTYEETLDFIQKAADFVEEILYGSIQQEVSQ